MGLISRCIDVIFGEDVRNAIREIKRRKRAVQLVIYRRFWCIGMRWVWEIGHKCKKYTRTPSK